MMIINGGIQSHDIASVLTESSGHMYMAVVLHWAFSGDIDIESERFRLFGGEIRTWISALFCIALKRAYHGQLSYLPIEEGGGNGDPMTNQSNRPLPSFSLSDPVPDNWKTIEGNFVVFFSFMCSHVADSIIGHPDMRIGAGKQNIVYAFDDVKRSELLLGMSDVKNRLKCDSFNDIHAREFRLTPFTPGIISIDGEKIEYGSVQIKILPGMMRLFSRKKLK